MHNCVDQLITVEKEIKTKLIELNYKNYNPKIIAVSKTFAMSSILPLINYGQKDFGENKVQEAMEKWTNMKSDCNHLNLHMRGKLQTNKVKYAVSLFDYIHSLDNLKLAEKIANEELKQKKKVKVFVQINVGDEDQKSGISILNADKFCQKCIKDLGLNIVGLMCIPPNQGNMSLYFSKIKNLSNQLNLKELSMGMSGDYIDAIKFSSTYLRIGSKIFGNRT